MASSEFKFEGLLETITVVALLVRLIRKVRSLMDPVEIVKDSNPTDDIDYSVKFEGGKLVADVRSKKLGLSNQTVLDGTIVVDALIDAIEKGIPGDQKPQAEMLKQLARGTLAKQLAGG